MYLVALDTASSKFFFVAGGAVDFLLPGDEALGANWRLADATAEAWLVPLSRLVFHLLRACKTKSPIQPQCTVHASGAKGK